MPRITFQGKTYYSEFEMPPNIRRAYQKDQMREANTKSLADVVDMKHLPSDERIYRPSAPVIDPEHSTIEPDSGLVLRGLAVGVLCALIVAVIIYLALLFLR